LKICHYIWGANFGGTWTLVRTIAKEQAKKHEVVILFAQKDNGVLDFDLPKVRVHNIEYKHNFDLSPTKIKKTIKFFKGFDVIHIHGLTYPIYLAAILSKVPIVFTFHGLLDFNNKVKNWRNLLKFFMMRQTFGRYVSMVTTNSFFMRKELEERYFENLPIEVVYNCYEIPDDNSHLENIVSDDFKILTFSRLVPYKRVELFLDIISKLVDINIVGEIYGDGPERGKLMKTINELKLSVTLFSFTKNIHSRIETADLCLFPAKGEPFGISALEVLSHGKIPLVFSDGGGLVEIVAPLHDGLFIVNNTDQAVALIRRFYNNPSELDQFKESCKKRANDFSVDKISGIYIHHYLTVINRKELIS